MSGLNLYRQHIDLANDRFVAAEEMMGEEKEHMAAHLFINAAINYHNALCQKFLNGIPSHKQHSDTSYFNELKKFLGGDLPDYKEAYAFLMRYKSQADYGGTEISTTTAKQIQRRALKIRGIVEHLL